MTQITCTCFDCKFCNDNAQCTAKEINLSFGNIATVWEGRQDVWWCKTYEMSDEAKATYEEINKFFKGGE